MQLILKFLMAFLALTGAVALATSWFGIEFENANFWNYHGFWFLFFITVFPRLTLLFSSVTTGGILWWLSWLFAPRLLVAVLATWVYWNANPGLVVCAWLVFFSGETSEKYFVVRRTQNLRSENWGRPRREKWVDIEVKDVK